MFARGGVEPTLSVTDFDVCYIFGCLLHSPMCVGGEGYGSARAKGTGHISAPSVHGQSMLLLCSAGRVCPPTNAMAAAPSWLWQVAPCVPARRCMQPHASEVGKLMRIATPAALIDAALEDALQFMELTPQKTAAALTLQHRLELTPAETVKLLLSNPQVLENKYNHDLEATLDIVQAMLGLSQAELAKVIRACPQVLSLSKSDALVQRIDDLREIMQCDALELGRAVLKFPRVMTLSIEANARPTAQALQRMLALSDDELHRLIRKHPQVLSLSTEGSAQQTLDVLRDTLALDDGQLRSLVIKLPQALGLNAENNLRPKLGFIADALCFSPSELRDAVMREPLILGCSLERSLRPNVKAWRDALRAHPQGESDLKRLFQQNGLRPLTASFEKRTRPRLSKLEQAGLDPREALSRMRMTDAAFDQWIATHLDSSESR